MVDGLGERASARSRTRQQRWFAGSRCIAFRTLARWNRASIRWHRIIDAARPHSQNRDAAQPNKHTQF
jgi:hypothetical protein